MERGWGIKGAGATEGGDAEVLGELMGCYGVWWGRNWGVQRAVGTEGGGWEESRMLRVLGWAGGKDGGVKGFRGAEVG